MRSPRCLQASRLRGRHSGRRAHPQLVDEAEAQLRHAYRIWVSRFGPDHYEAAVCLHGLGVVQYRRHRPEAAHLLLRKALRIKTTVLGPDHQEIAILLRNLTVVRDGRRHPCRIPRDAGRGAGPTSQNNAG